MKEGPAPAAVFASPEEEVAYLRAKIAEKEKELIQRNPEADTADYETIGRGELKEYGEHAPDSMLEKEYRMQGVKLAGTLEQIDTAHDKAEEIVRVAEVEGIRNALTVLEEVNDAFLTDEVHRRLIEDIRAGRQIAQLKEGVPPWNVLHMTLFSIALPDTKKEEDREKELREMISAMEQFYAGMQSVSGEKGRSALHFTLEVAVSDKSDDIVFYTAVPSKSIDLFEKHILSLFPHAVVTEEAHDYNVFVDGGVSLLSTASLKKHPIYPLRMYDTFDRDPLNVLLNVFSKIEREGGGASVQFSVKPSPEKYHSAYKKIIDKIKDGVPTRKAVNSATIGGEFMEFIKDEIKPKKKGEKDEPHSPDIDEDAVELFQSKIASQIVECNIRIAVSAREEMRARQILTEIESSFHQFENTNGNKLTFTALSGKKLERELKAFSFREFSSKSVIPLSIAELTTLIHFPAEGIDSSPQFKQSQAKSAAAPSDLPKDGTLIGTNRHRNVKKDIYVTDEDRLRHFYIIGQTGTGKTTLMKNMIMQDIEKGNGVCMIDPHGTDIEDVLALVPPEREDDVIYFDPAYTERVMGLNMLEYDESKPEQKTFVVNELFSIFQKLYGAVPESMGPMFEQYFRNATMLVLEDQESGSTLLDVSRVLSDAAYRRLKLSKAKNPVVVQFWQEIATKAGGEAALENIVPYITSKFDVFTANDYMRPIIGQQQSSFNFRDIMDERKILLVNLSKGRLGDINANLIGMIIVGKILMAALSRVDTPQKANAPFYLHMDEFQNITTDSITAILSEARKYSLGLTIAHQYIQQIEEKIRDAVFGNVGSVAAFRVGPEDAEFLEKQFTPVFTAADLINIENRTAYVRLLANGKPTKPFSIETMAPPEVQRDRVRDLKEQSYRKYGLHRGRVEMDIVARYQR